MDVNRQTQWRRRGGSRKFWQFAGTASDFSCHLIWLQFEFGHDKCVVMYLFWRLKWNTSPFLTLCCHRSVYLWVTRSAKSVAEVMRSQRYQPFTRKSFREAFSSLSRCWNQRYLCLSHLLTITISYLKCDVGNSSTSNLAAAENMSLSCVSSYTGNRFRGAHTEDLCSLNLGTMKGKLTRNKKVRKQLKAKCLGWALCECSNLWLI